MRSRGRRIARRVARAHATPGVSGLSPGWFSLITSISDRHPIGPSIQNPPPPYRRRHHRRGRAGKSHVKQSDHPGNQKGWNGVEGTDGVGWDGVEGGGSMMLSDAAESVAQVF